jgi:hypothetical protein
MYSVEEERTMLDSPPGAEKEETRLSVSNWR